jgi:hypothetical protein
MAMKPRPLSPCLPDVASKSRISNPPTINMISGRMLTSEKNPISKSGLPRLYMTLCTKVRICTAAPFR